MLNNALAFLARIVVGKQIVTALAAVHDALDGHRTEIVAGVLALVHGLKLAGIIAPAIAAPIEASLGSILPVVLADRMSKVLGSVDAVVPPADPKP